MGSCLDEWLDTGIYNLRLNGRERPQPLGDVDLAVQDERNFPELPGQSQGRLHLCLTVCDDILTIIIITSTIVIQNDDE